MKNRTALLIIAFFSVTGAFVAWGLSFSGKDEVSSLVGEETAVTTGAASSTETVRPIYGNDVSIQFDDTETVTPSVPVPDLRRVPLVGPSTAPVTVERALPAIKALQSKLQSNSRDFTSWLELGLQFSSVGDFEGARIAYEYACALRPTSSVSFANLGFVYAYHLKNPAKSEQAYLTAIKNDPTQEYIQIQLFEVYRDVFADKAKAESFARSRIQASPEFALDFTQMIAELNRR